jgi:hypothetical protein
MSQQQFDNKFNDINQENLGQIFQKSCEDGDLDKVQFILSGELKNNLPFANLKGGLYQAFIKDELKIIQYILSQNNDIDIHMDADSCFYHAFFNWSQNSLRYIIFDLNISKTESIEKHINMGKNINNFNNLAENINNWFEKRDLHNDLINGLETSLKNENNKKPKL